MNNSKQPSASPEAPAHTNTVMPAPTGGRPTRYFRGDGVEEFLTPSRDTFTGNADGTSLYHVSPAPVAKGEAGQRKLQQDFLGQIRKRFNDADLHGHYNLIQQISDEIEEGRYVGWAAQPAGTPEQVRELIASHVPSIGTEGEYQCESHWIQCSCGWNLADALDQGSEPINWESHIEATLAAAPQSQQGEGEGNDGR